MINKIKNLQLLIQLNMILNHYQQLQLNHKKNYSLKLILIYPKKEED